MNDNSITLTISLTREQFGFLNAESAAVRSKPEETLKAAALCHLSSTVFNEADLAEHRMGLIDDICLFCDNNHTPKSSTDFRKQN